MLKLVLRLLGSAVLFKAGNQLQSYLLKPSDFEKNMERLNQEEWFAELRRDFRYDHILLHNTKVKKSLGDAKYIGRLVESKEEQQKFTDLVQQEYIKLMKK